MNQEQKKILLAYKTSHNELKAKIAEIFEKYSIGDSLSFSDMQKYDRMKKLIYDIELQYKQLAKVEIKELFKGLEREYQVNYLWQGFEIERQAGIRLRYGLVNPNLVRQAIQNEISGMPISVRVLKNITNNIYDIRTAITQGLIQGESYQSIVKRLRGEQEKQAFQVKRIVQTEAHRIQNLARQDSILHAQELGVVVRKRWMSAGDRVVRDTHKSLDGQYADKDGFFYSNGAKSQYPGGFGVPEEDINCRCTMVTEVERVGDKEISKREWVESHKLPEDISQGVMRIK
jgi:SPP1 gp7 family putative phage head morphogenesis protein